MDRRMSRGAGSTHRHEAGRSRCDHLLPRQGRGGLAQQRRQRMTEVRIAPHSTAASERLFDAAQRVLPGGVNSPVRAFKGVGGIPRFIVRGEGPALIDADGNRYVDLVLSWGPLILGHAHPEVVAALTEA